jgi:predicted nucleic acid-binding protein
MRRISIDTNIYAAFMTGDKSVVEAFSNADFIGVDITVIAELLTGFLLGSRQKQNRAELQKFLENRRVSILYPDLETADFYAAVVKQLKAKGRPIPTNDIWIAANAMRQGLSLYSFDAHFREIEGLLLV